MQKRHWVVGVVMVLASAVSYGLVHMTAASPIEVVEAAMPMMGVTSAGAPPLMMSPAANVGEMFGALSDTTMMFATGVALIGIAAGVRRHTC